jgi:hypothetical protein
MLRGVVGVVVSSGLLRGRGILGERVIDDPLSLSLCVVCVCWLDGLS